jgi:hypothetical protein
MHFHLNWLAILVTGIVIFLLGGLWYSPILFAKKWIALQGRTEEEMKAQAAASNMPVMYMSAFIGSFLVAWAMAVMVAQFAPAGVFGGIHVGLICWLGFAAATSYSTALFSGKPKQLWLIDSAYNLVSFLIAGAILAVWR